MNGLIPINLAPTPGGRVLITVAWNPATREHAAFGLLVPVATARDEHGAPCPECGRCMVDVTTFRHYGWYSYYTLGYLPHGDPCGPGTDHQPWCSAMSAT